MRFNTSNQGGGELKRGIIVNVIKLKTLLKSLLQWRYFAITICTGIFWNVPQLDIEYSFVIDHTNCPVIVIKLGDEFRFKLLVYFLFFWKSGSLYNSKT